MVNGCLICFGLNNSTDSTDSITTDAGSARVVLGDEGKPELLAQVGIAPLLMQDIQAEAILAWSKKTGIPATGAVKSLADIMRHDLTAGTLD